MAPEAQGGAPPVKEEACAAAIERGYAGPYLRYINIIPDEKLWLGSVLLLVRGERVQAPDNDSAQGQHAAIPATIQLWEAGREGEETGQSQVRLLTEVEGWQAWRFTIRLPVTAEQRPITYTVNVGGVQTQPCVFWIPGSGLPMHWGYTSCNGLSADVPADAPERLDKTYLWRDLLQVHDAYPMHCLFGGGDQVYNDLVWSTPALKAWGQMPSGCGFMGFFSEGAQLACGPEKVGAPWSKEMLGQSTAFYTKNYIDVFSGKDVATAMACIPQLMCWDDHDIWDGWGSYREEVQRCGVFQELFKVAERMYLLFQKHTTVELARTEGEYLIPGNYHSIHYLGPTVSLFVIDMRTNRSRTACVREADYPLLKSAALALPGTVEHLVVASGVPLVWPNIPAMELMLRGLEKLINTFSCLMSTTKKSGLVDRFDQPEILDDLHDGWTADLHKEEKHKFIAVMQEIADARGLRISILSGDAHVAGVGRLYSQPKYKHMENDPHFMPQITSSAIVNAPPPRTVVNMLTRLNFSFRINKHTRQKMVRVFYPEHKRLSKILPQRNWCDVTLVAPPFSEPQTPGESSYGALRFVLRVEDTTKRRGFAEETYSIVVPKFIPENKVSTDKGKRAAVNRAARKDLQGKDVRVPAVFFSLDGSSGGPDAGETENSSFDVRFHPQGGLAGKLQPVQTA